MFKHQTGLFLWILSKKLFNHSSQNLQFIIQTHMTGKAFGPLSKIISNIASKFEYHLERM